MNYLPPAASMALPDLSAEKSERLQTHLPRTQSVVMATHHESKPEGLEYEALLI